MKQYTLLEIMNIVMDTMDSDPVTDISETPESQQILNIIQAEYFRLAADSDWKHLRVITQLEEMSSTYPNYMKIPATIESVETIKYNTKESASDADKFEELTYVEDVSEFLNLVHSLDSTDSTVDTVTDPDGAGTVYCYNDRVPKYYTSIDDTYLVFDAYLSTLDTYLKANKSLVVGYKTPTFTESNSYVLDMPGRMFPAFLERVIAVCHADIKQVESSVHTRQSISGTTRIHQKSSKTKNPRGVSRRPRFGWR
jgi:hypothetical protein